MKVSVIIANYNYERYLKEAVDSVLTQTYSNLEIVLVDDGSTDGSRSLITQLQEQHPDKIKVLFQENQGHGEAINTGFKLCEGEIIAFLDSDDIWDKRKLEIIMPYFDRTDAVGVIHPLNTINKNGVITDPGTPVLGLENGDLASLVKRTGHACRYPPTTGLAFRRSALEIVLPMDPPEWREWPDGCLLYCAAFLGKVYATDQVLATYRVHGQNTYWREDPSDEQYQQSNDGVALTNRWLNNFLKKINSPDHVDLSKNLDRRRSQYYLKRELNFREAVSISQLILDFPFYSIRDRLYFLGGLWLKSLRFSTRKVSL